jgi:hypothetical protein
MITKTIDYWTLTQLVKERIAIDPVKAFIAKHFGPDWEYNIFKTVKDEVLQIYNEDTCYTVIGGSSADKAEWRSNFNAFPLVNRLIHRGFWNGANEVYTNSTFIKRGDMIYIGHSRGGAIASIMVYLFGGVGIGFGTPKAFTRKVKIRFVNVRNALDPVVHVVPFFKTVGTVVRMRFAKNPHTKYGRNIGENEEVTWN